MNASDRKKWASARTLADLGKLTARWLEGDLASQPGYCGPSDIEDPALVPLLAKLNRAGFMTTCSQIGSIEHEQRAAVEGFASLTAAARLISAANDAGMIVVAHDPAVIPRWRFRYGRSVTVTRVGGRRFTGFGAQVPRRHIRDGWIGYGICSREAQAALCAAWQVTLIDPEWGRAGLLWQVLGGVS
jgi:hypothetical protein